MSFTRALRGGKHDPIPLLRPGARREARHSRVSRRGLERFTSPQPFDHRASSADQRDPAGDAADHEPPVPRTLSLGEINYDIERGEMWRGDAPVRLTATEATLMRIFAACPGEPVSRSRLVGDLARSAGHDGAQAHASGPIDVPAIYRTVGKRLSAPKIGGLDPKRPRLSCRDCVTRCGVHCCSGLNGHLAGPVNSKTSSPVSDKPAARNLWSKGRGPRSGGRNGGTWRFCPEGGASWRPCRRSRGDPTTDVRKLRQTPGAGLLANPETVASVGRVGW